MDVTPFVAASCMQFLAMFPAMVFVVLRAGLSAVCCFLSLAMFVLLYTVQAAI